MTKTELLAAARGKPEPFECGGVTFHLLPIPFGELKRLQSSHEAGNKDTAEAFTYTLIARAVCDECGALLLDPADCESLPLPTIEALFNEVARRSGIGKRGNGEPPATPN